MTFWSGEKLEEELSGLIEGYDPSYVDCAAYTLHLGVRVFVTNEQIYDGDSLEGHPFTLDNKQQFSIPPGQFAFLLTKESVRVPHNATAFISMKARIKFKGLINVSGFHVDPGWNGQLIFSVYNAGPTSVVLQEGMPLFLIWYADLDRSSERIYKGAKRDKDEIPTDLVQSMVGQVFSPIALNKSVGELKEKVSNFREQNQKDSSTLSDKVTTLEGRVDSQKTHLNVTTGVITALLIATIVALGNLYLRLIPVQSPQAILSPAAPQPIDVTVIQNPTQTTCGPTTSAPRPSTLSVNKNQSIQGAIQAKGAGECASTAKP